MFHCFECQIGKAYSFPYSLQYRLSCYVFKSLAVRFLYTAPVIYSEKDECFVCSGSIKFDDGNFGDIIWRQKNLLMKFFFQIKGYCPVVNQLKNTLFWVKMASSELK